MGTHTWPQVGDEIKIAPNNVNEHCRGNDPPCRHSGGIFERIGEVRRGPLDGDTPVCVCVLAPPDATLRDGLTVKLASFIKTHTQRSKGKERRGKCVCVECYDELLQLCAMWALTLMPKTQEDTGSAYQIG